MPSSTSMRHRAFSFTVWNGTSTALTYPPESWRLVSVQSLIAFRCAGTLDIRMSSEELRYSFPSMTIVCSIYSIATAPASYRRKLWRLSATIRISSLVAAQHGIPFFVFPVTPENKEEQERRQIGLLRELKVDLIVLARYMQVLTSKFVQAYCNRIINIHHSFLPAFIGKKPYDQAYERGVKLIGATSHYVTEELDQGPIIDQDVCRVSHRDSVSDMIAKGRDLERQVLGRGVRLHLLHRVLPYGRKTVIFV